jgi:hypothetical protein
MGIEYFEQTNELMNYVAGNIVVLQKKHCNTQLPFVELSRSKSAGRH